MPCPAVRAAAATDPRGFLEAYPPPVILDEVQYAPDLLPYIKERIDQRRSRRGQYLLTGSQNLLLISRVTETLAGRAAMLRLLPLSRREALGNAERPLPWEKGGQEPPARTSSFRGLWTGLLRGGYPELVVEPDRDIALWHTSYIQTYLERDVRSLRQVGDLTSFQAFLRALAARSGQLLSLSDLARDLGVAVNTAKAWLSVLEATFQVLVLRPYFANVGKRLVIPTCTSGEPRPEWRSILWWRPTPSSSRSKRSSRPRHDQRWRMLFCDSGETSAGPSGRDTWFIRGT